MKTYLNRHAVMQKKIMKYEFRVQSDDFLVTAKIFQFQCSAFYICIDIHLDRYNKPCIPTPAQLCDAMYQISEHGSLNKLALLPAVSFFMRGDGFEVSKDEYGINIAPDLDVYLNQLNKAYSAFYNSFNPNNYLLIK